MEYIQNNLGTIIPYVLAALMFIGAIKITKKIIKAVLFVLVMTILVTTFLAR